MPVITAFSGHGAVLKWGRKITEDSPDVIEYSIAGIETYPGTYAH